MGRHVHTSIDRPLGIPFDWLVEVGFRPGVTDNVARTAREALERTLRIRFRPGEGVYTRKLYFIKGNISKQEADTIARDLLANDLIQTRTVFAPKDDREAIVIPRVSTRADVTVRGIDLNVDEKTLLQISSEGILALNLEEMEVIRNYFSDRELVARRSVLGLKSTISTWLSEK